MTNLLQCKIGNGIEPNKELWLAKGRAFHDGAVKLIAYMMSGSGIPIVMLETLDADFYEAICRPVSRWIAPPLMRSPHRPYGDGVQMYICTNCGRSAITQEPTCAKGCRDA